DSLSYLGLMSQEIYYYVGLLNFFGRSNYILDSHLILSNYDKSDKIDGYLYRKYPAIKIARLAVDRRLEKRGVGRYILLAAVGKAISVSNDIGCRYITVDSKPESTGFYEKHNFKMVEKYRRREFPKMYLNMYPIVATMRAKESLKQFEN
ncbi:MAG: GNAT family N-acetyltransferase, partial [Candidatus Methanoperedens sp.]|nr:GNAT family N-acetyltransferase [Candidatus Methanoperedens sp.]